MLPSGCAVWRYSYMLEAELFLQPQLLSFKANTLSKLWTLFVRLQCVPYREHSRSQRLWEPWRLRLPRQPGCDSPTYSAAQTKGITPILPTLHHWNTVTISSNQYQSMLMEYNQLITRSSQQKLIIYALIHDLIIGRFFILILINQSAAMWFCYFGLYCLCSVVSSASGST
jgi:hypothetical protein